MRFNDPDDLRVHDLIHADAGAPADVAILGAPFDGGVVAGGGRAGAAEGPSAVRRMLQRAGTLYQIERDVSIAELRVVDAGDVAANAPADEHGALQSAVASLLNRNVIPIVIGGGHDLTYATVAALAGRQFGRIGGVNIDAHLDVRPVVDGRITSGTPFRRIIEGLPSVIGTRLVTLGPHGNRNAKGHIDWYRGHGGRVLTLSEARRLGAEAAMTAALEWATGGQTGGSSPPVLFISLDIDSAAQAYAPGCSAPSPDGFRPDDLLQFAFLAGRHPNVACLDIMEVNPRYDVDDRTAALAAAALVHFLFGVAARRRAM
jgi:formimidoylglutamase